MFDNSYELNYTKLKSYLDCPLSYKYKFIDRKRPPLNANASLGLSLHNALDIYFRNNKTNLDDLLNAYIDNWVNAGFKTEQSQVEFYEKGKKLLETFWNTDKQRRSEVIYTEKNFEFNHGKWIVRGTIDRVDKTSDGKWELIDYKTGPEIKTQKELSKDFQLAIYAIGLKRNFDITPHYLSIYFLAYDKKVTVSYDKTTESEILKKIEDIGEEILKSDFKPRTQYCPICPFNKMCSFSTV